MTFINPYLRRRTPMSQAIAPTVDELLALLGATQAPFSTVSPPVVAPERAPAPPAPATMQEAVMPILEQLLGYQEPVAPTYAAPITQAPSFGAPATEQLASLIEQYGGGGTPIVSGPMGDIPISALQQMAGGPAGLGSAATHYTGLQQWVPKLWERYPTQYQFTPQAVPWRQMGYMGAQTPVSTPQQTVARMALGLMPWMTPIEQRQWAMWIQANAPELTRGEQGPALSVKKFEEWNPLTAAQAMTPEERYAYESADRVRQIAYALGLAGGQGWTQPTGPGGGMGTLIPNPQNPWGQVYDPLQTALKTALAYSPGGTITGERPRRTAAEQRLFEKEWETLMNWAPSQSQLPLQTQGMIQGQTGADPAQTWALMQPFLTQLLGPWGRTWEKEPGWTRAAHAPIRTSPWLLTPSTTRQQRR